MLQSIENHYISPEKSKNPQQQAPRLKKSCLLKKKLEGAPQKLKIDNISCRYINVSNIVYIDINALSTSSSVQPNFLNEIFNFNTISKVTKNRDRTTLSLKLCPKLSKTSLCKTSQNCLTQTLKKCPITHFNISDEKNSFRINVQKIHNILHQQQQVLRQKNQDQNFNPSIYLCEDKVSRNIDEMILNIQSNHYIIFENLFKPSNKRIKNIHFSNDFLRLIGRFNENLAFQLLQKRSLPFQIFKKFDTKLFAEKNLKHFAELFESLFNKKDPSTLMKEQNFAMEGIIQGKDQKEKTVKLKWTCSHPSIIMMEIFEQKEKNKDTQTTKEKDKQNQILVQFQNIKIQ